MKKLFPISNVESAGFCFANQLEMDDAGWAQLAPFGDFPGTALVSRPDGSVKKFAALQRLDRAAAEAMVAQFKSPWRTLKRYFTGCPIYAGHPDTPAGAAEFADKIAKGLIVDLQARGDGLYCRPVFTNEGSELVESRALRALSAYWSAREIGEQAGPDGQPLKIYRPDALKSAGLTNQPNLPVRPLCAPPALSTKTPPTNQTQTQIVNKQILIDFLAAQGVTVANESPDAQIAAALAQLGDRLTVAETSFAARALELETLHAELANERRFHADTLLDAALAAGCLTAAQRPDWAGRFAADFANTAAALAQLAPALKTRSLTLNQGARKAELANATDRRDALDNLVRAEMTVNGGDYARAFAAVQRNQPALFSAMKQPMNPS